MGYTEPTLLTTGGDAGNEVQAIKEHKRRKSVGGLYSVTTQGEEDRGQWTSRTEFILCLLGYAIGIGNLWRFPYLVGKYGGGAFLIPYFMALVIIASPLYLMELIIGQKFRQGSVEAFRSMSPYFAGLGYASMVMVFILSSYYNLLLAYSLVYVFYSFSAELPWTAEGDLWKELVAQNDGAANTTTPTMYFYDNIVLRKVPAIDSVGGSEMHGPLVIGLSITWLVILLALAKGIKSTGKVAYVTVLLPILLIVILFFRCVLLEGAGDGVLYYITPRLEAFADPEIWGTAASQIVFSLSPAMGTAVALASFNQRSENVYFDNIFVAICNSSFSIFGGFVVFSVIGYQHAIQNVAIESVAKSGQGLAFIVFAEALGTMGGGKQFFSVLFFFMLFTLGLDSSFAWVETLNTFVDDALRKNGRHVPRPVITVVMCVIMFLSGLPYCTRAGSYYLDIVDHFCSAYTLLIVGFGECIMVGWIYGPKRLANDMFEMTGKRISMFWQICWKFVTPALIVILLFSLLIPDLVTPYAPCGTCEPYPAHALAAGWLTIVFPLLCIPTTAYFAYRESSRSKALQKGQAFHLFDTPAQGQIETEMGSLRPKHPDEI